MKKLAYLSVCLFLMGLASSSCSNKSKKMEQKTETQLVIETNKGNITVKLYNETPLHRDNFIKLANDGFYEGTLFHRVIKKFMIQAGDPKSKDAPADSMLGDGFIGYCLPAEFVPNIIHKRGALAAAREGDDINPKKESDGSQFYIVTGKTFTAAQLDAMESEINQACYEEAYDSIKRPYIKELYMLRKKGDKQALVELQSKLEAEAKSMIAHNPPFAWTKLQRDTYTSIGGTPHLDGNYTVFGEVLEGMDVVDNISMVRTNRADRPVEDVVIKKVTVIK